MISYDVKRDYVSKEQFEEELKYENQRWRRVEEDRNKHRILLEELAKRITFLNDPWIREWTGGGEKTDTDILAMADKAIKEMREMIDEFTEHSGEIPCQFASLTNNEMIDAITQIGDKDAYI